jgi:predicted aminopeptidase
MTPRLGRAAFAVLAGVLPLSGCYLLESAAGQIELTNKEQPISQVLADPDTSPALRHELTEVRDIREFASTDLKLPDNGSYKSYADLGRRFVVWNVYAAPEFSVEPKTWCFPFVGCVAYRGYFNELEAQDYAYRLRREGYDVLVGGVAAYSTLGHFHDPVLNTMLGWDESELAAIIFHELAHQLLYVPGDSAFNEAFATTVEREGVRRWLARQGRAIDEKDYAARDRRAREVAELVAQARSRLKALYAQSLSPEQLRTAKAAEFERLRNEYAALPGAESGYAWLFGPDLNNAALSSVATYYDCVPGFEAQLRAVDGDLPRFYAAARALANEPADARRAQLCTAGSDQ